MTMPYERTRAIGWGWELLEELANDELLSEAARTQARALRSVYPSSEALEQLLREATKGLPPAWADALVEAGTLFTNLQDAGQGDERTRKGLRCTLRHFPEGRAIRGMERSALIGYWLEADGESSLARRA
jgi:hypothetical protein